MHFHAHCCCQAGCLAADGAVPQNADGLGGGVFDGIEVASGPTGLVLEGEVMGQAVVEGEVGEEEVFGDLGAVGVVSFFFSISCWIWVGTWEREEGGRGKAGKR